MNTFSKHLILGLGLVICLASAEKIYGNPPDASTGFVNVVDYGADGSDERDDTEAIQNAIDALSKSNPTGGVVYFPNGNYRVGDPDIVSGHWNGILLHDGITIQGTNSVHHGNCQILLTNDAEGSEKAIFIMVGNTERVVIHDLTLAGPQGDPTTTQTKTMGVRATGTDGGFAFGLQFSNLTFSRFDKAISFDADPPATHNWQFTLVKLDHVNFWECNTDVHLNTINTDWEMTSCLFGVYKDGVAIDVERGGFLTIQASQAGGGAAGTGEPPGGANAANTFIWVRGNPGNSHGNITLTNVQAEGFRSAMKIDLADYTYPITLVNSAFGDLIQIRASCIFNSTGNGYRANTVRTVPPPAHAANPNDAEDPTYYPGATHALVFSQGDYFSPMSNVNQLCDPLTPECPRDFIIKDQFNASGVQLTHNALVMRAGETRVDVGRPARFSRPVGIGNVDAPEIGNPGVEKTVLLNLATPDPNDVQLRIGGSAFDENGHESCPTCYYEIKRNLDVPVVLPDPIGYCSPLSYTNCTLGYLSFEGKQTAVGSAHIGFKFNGPIVPFADGTGTLGTSVNRWDTLYARNTVIGDAILTDKKTGKELYRIYEDVNNIYFADVRTGKELMRLDRDGNLHVTGRIIEGAGRALRKHVTKGNYRSRRNRH